MRRQGSLSYDHGTTEWTFSLSPFFVVCSLIAVAVLFFGGNAKPATYTQVTDAYTISQLNALANSPNMPVILSGSSVR